MPICSAPWLVKMYSNNASSASPTFAGFSHTKYLRLLRLKSCSNTRGAGMRSSRVTSALTAGVAVAVRAMMGTAGYCCRRKPRSL